MWTRNKVRYRKVESRGGRWGGSKIHIATYHQTSRWWEPVCMPEPTYGFGMGYHYVDDSTPTTCKKCLKKGVDK